MVLQPPPPLQREAIPYFPLFYFNTEINDKTTLDPLKPIG